MKIGIIREGKIPPDSRVPLTPEQCAFIQANTHFQLVVQPSERRCFPDDAYREAGIRLSHDLSDCDILLGVKEVPIPQFIPGKTYFFFSHTIKEQAYNQRMLQHILQNGIRLIDYEVLTDEQGKRVIAFGKFAGMVGAHNTLWAFGKRTRLFELPRMKDLYDYAAAKKIYARLKLPPVRIVLTGVGRVGQGAARVLRDMDILCVAPSEFLTNEYNQPVFTQLDCHHYVMRKDGHPFKRKDFHTHPTQFRSAFHPFTRVSDLMINGIYWDTQAPPFFSAQDMTAPDFRIRGIGDVTCDIAPESSIPATLRATTIDDPVFGYDPQNREETQAFREGVIDLMTIDNLPSELPRDASEAFGEQFIEHVLPELNDLQHSPMLSRATIAMNGNLGPCFHYLKHYAFPESVEI